MSNVEKSNTDVTKSLMEAANKVTNVDERYIPMHQEPSFLLPSQQMGPPEEQDHTNPPLQRPPGTPPGLKLEPRLPRSPEYLDQFGNPIDNESRPIYWHHPGGQPLDELPPHMQELLRKMMKKKRGG